MEGIKYIHARGYVHLDIKLANIFSRPKELNGGVRRLILGDFGLCHKVEEKSGLAFVKYSCGTFGYKPPEVKDHSYVS